MNPRKLSNQDLVWDFADAYVRANFPSGNIRDVITAHETMSELCNELLERLNKNHKENTNE